MDKKRIEKLAKEYTKDILDTVDAYSNLDDCYEDLEAVIIESLEEIITKIAEEAKNG